MAEVTTKLTRGASKAGSSYSKQQAVSFDFTKSSDGVPGKPKPKPRPIKGKASTGELGIDRKSTRLNSSHLRRSRMPSSA